ncbi:hypothetical protein EJ04DRAFT_570170 [Polyplosphaeria fusca]|uniref:Uncharacterized protein n=1 Tax=Polyplosphaeria fusca TaxID=682080 RepID=A0A9P4UW93_9PLEO|nr:hypothetical protein EJ04DRAFT_570170 [Polyplosphaeria fusca]
MLSLKHIVLLFIAAAFATILWAGDTELRFAVGLPLFWTISGYGLYKLKATGHHLFPHLLRSYTTFTVTTFGLLLNNNDLFVENTVDRFVDLLLDNDYLVETWAAWGWLLTALYHTAISVILTLATTLLLVLAAILYPHYRAFADDIARRDAIFAATREHRDIPSWVVPTKLETPKPIDIHRMNLRHQPYVPVWQRGVVARPPPPPMPAQPVEINLDWMHLDSLAASGLRAPRKMFA